MLGRYKISKNIGSKFSRSFASNLMSEVTASAILDQAYQHIYREHQQS